jgi:hypothetical protein
LEPIPKQNVHHLPLDLLKGNNLLLPLNQLIKLEEQVFKSYLYI